jgi:predicted ATPase
MRARVTGVAIENYRSIASCDVALQPLTLLVGPNGAGKSNFLDTLRFLEHSMHAPLEQVIEARYGMRSLLRKLPGGRSAESFRIGIDFSLAEGTSGTYSLSIAEGKDGAAVITEERCMAGKHHFTSRPGEVDHTAQSTPAFTGDRPALVSFGSLPQFSEVFGLVSGFTFYSPVPEKMRKPTTLGPGKVLARDASNAADVLARIERSRPDIAARLKGYLISFNPEFGDVTVVETDSFRWLSFSPAGHPAGWHLNGADVSDGTLRATAILLAVFQAITTTPPLSLVGVEEPESNLHPAAAGVLLDALLEASCAVPIIASTHSADLLDRKDLPADSLLAVALEEGTTVIGQVNDSSRTILRKRLYTAGELLRNNRLTPASNARHEIR